MLWIRCDGEHESIEPGSSKHQTLTRSAVALSCLSCRVGVVNTAHVTVVHVRQVEEMERAMVQSFSLADLVAVID